MSLEVTSENNQFEKYKSNSGRTNIDYGWCNGYHDPEL